jgi:hypothetical protein
MKRSIVNNHEILSDKSGRIWVNGPNGASVARYSPRAGRDVHQPMDVQRATGGECLDCSPDTDVQKFAASVLEHYKIKIPKKHLSSS